MKRINIAFASDDNYYLPLKTVVFSFFKNNPNIIFNFYFFGNISKHNYEDLNTLIKKYNSYLYTIDYDYSVFRKYYDGPNGFYITMKRLLLPFYLKKLDKLLYIDCDTVVNGNINTLYETNNENVPICACYDLANTHELIIKHKKNYSLSNYFNAGVLLMNCKYISENYTIDDLIAVFKNSPDPFPYKDQDAINIMFNDKIKPLDGKYNFQMRQQSKVDLKTIKQAVIIHYLNFKPWKKEYPFFTRKTSVYWKYGKKSYGFKRYCWIRFCQFNFSLVEQIKILYVKIRRKIIGR